MFLQITVEHLIICLIHSSYFKTVRQKLAGGRGLFGERCLIFRLNLKLAVFAHFRSFKPQTLDRLIFRSTNPSMNPSTAAKQYFCKGRGPKEWSWIHFDTPCQQIQFNMELEWCPGLIHYDHIGHMLYSGLYISLDVLQS